MAKNHLSTWKGLEKLWHPISPYDIGKMMCCVCIGLMHRRYIPFSVSFLFQVVQHCCIPVVSSKMSSHQTFSAVSHHGRDFEFKALVVQKLDGKINDPLFEEQCQN